MEGDGHPTYLLFEDLAAQMEIPEAGILSRTLHADEFVRVVLFGFDQGEELSEHTASASAILHFVSGEANVTLGEDKIRANAGTWIWMPAHLRHSIQARTPLTLLLILTLQPSPKPAG